MITTRLIVATRNGVLALLAAAALTGCTAEQVYTGLQADHQRQCRLLPVWQQQHCLARHDLPWEDYRREREAIRR